MEPPASQAAPLPAQLPAPCAVTSSCLPCLGMWYNTHPLASKSLLNPSFTHSLPTAVNSLSGCIWPRCFGSAGGTGCPGRSGGCRAPKCRNFSLFFQVRSCGPAQNPPGAAAEQDDGKISLFSPSPHPAVAHAPILSWGGAALGFSEICSFGGYFQ